MLSGHPNPPFLCFMNCILHTNGYPPVCRETQSFYQSVFSNGNFLLIFAQINSTKSFDDDVICAWMNAANDFLPTLLPVLLYQEFQRCNTPEDVFINPTHVKQLILYTLKNDQNLNYYMENVDLSGENTDVNFVQSLQSLFFTPPTIYILYQVANEAARRFPKSTAHYYAVSKLIFDERFFESVKIEGADLSQIKDLLTFRNDHPRPDLIVELRAFLDSNLFIPEDFDLYVSHPIGEKDIQALIDCIFEDPQIYSDAFNKIDMSALLHRYKAASVGKICVIPYSIHVESYTSTEMISSGKMQSLVVRLQSAKSQKLLPILEEEPSTSVQVSEFVPVDIPFEAKADSPSILSYESFTVNAITFNGSSKTIFPNAELDIETLENENDSTSYMDIDSSDTEIDFSGIEFPVPA